MKLNHYIIHPIAEMREAPSRESRVVSQAIYSEEIQIKNEQNEWCLISTPDGYEGWVLSSSITTRQTQYYPTIRISRLRAHVYPTPDVEYGPLLTLPYEVSLLALDMNDARWMQVMFPDHRTGFIQKGDVTIEPKFQKKTDLIPFSFRFLGLPYTWGGRSSFGYDCSGFIQMLYRQIAIHLPRDARQQILDERFRTIALSDIEPGDLIFFGQSQQSIKHVGMYIGDGNFIHTSSRECLPWCRVSHLSDPEWNGQEESYFPFRVALQP